MFALFKQWFGAPKRIAFLDGDQPLPGILHAYDKYLKGTETHLVRLKDDSAGEPKVLRGKHGFNKIYLSGYKAGKEVTDKFIGAYIQKAVTDGYQFITVVSSDYDFIDTFKMAVVLNPEASKLTFRMIVPNARGVLKEMPDRVMNIEIVKC
jgi:hypothetical protein